MERITGSRVISAQRAPGGFSSAQRWLLDLDSGRQVFAKVGQPPVANQNLRAEAYVLERLSLRCMPVMLGWDDDPSYPLLVLESLADAEWPPPWSSEMVEASLAEIEDIHRSTGPLPPYAERHGSTGGWWASIEHDPEPALALGLFSEPWLRESLPALRQAEATVTPEGESVTHFDLRSDNLCRAGHEIRIIDWSHACLGNPELDLGLFLPGLASEGGPAPWDIMGRSPSVAAWVTGFFAVHASKGHIPTAPLVRDMQRRHLQHALPWAESALDLPPVETLT